MSWSPWTSKSESITFKSTIKGVGDGEQKVAAELDTPFLGQNSSYDMMLELNGVKTKCDVKKLDTQNDFNTGKEGRDALRPIKTLLTTFINSLRIFAASELFTPEQKGLLASLQDVSPDELAVGTLRKICETLVFLSSKKKELRSTLPLVPFTVNSQTHAMPLDVYYTLCQNLGLAFPSEFSSFIPSLCILQHMNNIYIDEPETLMNDLRSLAGKIFTDLKPIIVDKNKGYMILEDIDTIRFYRITRGNPRFQIIN